MNTLEHFAGLEGDAVRSDPDEGAHFALQISKLEIHDQSGEFVEIGGIINPIVSRRGTPSGVNVLCMYGIQCPLGYPIDARNYSFGDSFVVITNGEEFLNRVRRAILPNGRSLTLGSVEYVDRTTYHGPLGAFRKFSDKYSFQHEFRLVVSGGNGQVFEWPIGDISDICVIGPANEINDRLRVKPSA